MTKYNVGDRIRVLDSVFAKECGLTPGEEGTVRDPAEVADYIRVDLDHKSFDRDDIYFFEKHEIELVGTSNPEEGAPFQVGDRVTIYNVALDEAINSLNSVYLVARDLLPDLFEEPARFVTNGEGQTADTQISRDPVVSFNDAFGEYYDVAKGGQTVPSGYDSGVKGLKDLSIKMPEDLEQENDRKKPVVDMVNHPPHYTRGGIEVLDFILAYFADDYLGGQVVKYLSRAGHKWDALEDLKKAQFYLNRKIEEMEASK